LLTILASAAAGAAEGEDDVIRLAPRDEPVGGESSEQVEMTAPRRGFDSASFEARVESLWFQRKTLLASGRDQDSRAQLEQIRAFCEEEGIRRLEHLGGALVAEAHRFHEEGNHDHALTALAFADAFDPDRPQIHVARATVLWRSGGETLAAARELLRALKASAIGSARDLSLLPRLLFMIGLACIAVSLAFAGLMLLRHQAPMRHEAEEWAAGFLSQPWPEIAGWALLALPLIVWFGTGWAALYWLVIAFRFMSRREKLATVCVLLAGALTVPAYAAAVGLYGTSANPAVRTTITSVGGEYDPDRIVRLRRLVAAHPDDPVYRFLLAGLYKNGRYFEEAFEEYKAVLELDPSFVPALINIGNIFHTTGQYAAAITQYHDALALEPDSVLAHFNLHLTQSESFHFKEAEQSLQRARTIDADRVADLLDGSSDYDDRAAAQDATLSMVSVWEAALGGRSLADGAVRQASVASLLRPGQFVNALAIVCIGALLGCIALAVATGRAPLARRCIRCGRSFCHRCKRQREAHEYCGQCLHLYVLRDGLAPETKARKLFEVGRHERRTRRVRRLLSLPLPGSGHVLRGKTGTGLLLLALWFALLIGAAPEILTLLGEGGLQLSTDLLLAPDVPPRFDPHPGRYLAALALGCVWFVGNWRSWREREG
jgi:tetratricopeptide (TPR) repeat protein